MSLIDKIPQKTGEDLLNIFNNAVKKLEERKMVSEAEADLAYIEEKWHSQVA